MKMFAHHLTGYLLLVCLLALLVMSHNQVQAKPTLYHSTNDYGYGGTSGFQQSSGFNSNYGYGHSNAMGLGGLGGLPGYGGYGSGYGMAPVALGYPGPMMPTGYLPGSYVPGYGMGR